MGIYIPPTVDGSIFEKRWYKKVKYQIVIAIGAVVILSFLLLGGTLFTNPDLSTSIVITQDNVLVSREDISVISTDNTPPPAGFPDDTPFTPLKVLSTYSMEYPDRNLTQHSVSFVTNKKIEEVYNTYKEYLVVRGYMISSDSNVVTKANLYATKDNDDFSIVIKLQADKSILVQLAYVERP